MDEDLLYGDLYGEEKANAATATQSSASADPRRRPAGGPVPQNNQSQSFTPEAGPSYSSVQSFVPDSNQARPQYHNHGSGQVARTINTYHDSNEHRHLGPTPSSAGTGGPTYEDGKMFIGGLSWETTEDALQAYFSQYGTISSVSVMRDSSNGRSRGFAFLSFVDASSVNSVLAHQHYLDGKQIDPKRAVPPPNKTALLQEPRTEKLFVRSIAPEVTQESFRAYFAKFGTYTAATLMIDRETGQNRGYGFVDYENPDAVDAVLNSMPHYIDGYLVDTKKSHPKPRRDTDAAPGPAQQMPMTGGAMPMQPQAQAPRQAAAVGSSGVMTGPFNAQAIADYFRRITGGDASKLARFDPQKMFASIAATMPAPPQSRHNMPNYGAQQSAPPPQNLQRIATFQGDEPPPMRKAVAQHAGFDDNFADPRFPAQGGYGRGMSPTDASNGPRGGGPPGGARFHPYQR